MEKKRLQVFVSSTFVDLIPERQAAVEAILTAGHIPAGMELFTAGDQSQMDVIKRWIDDSDVYMLILGHRYGSIEPETGKSYTQLEYEYALAKKKPLFAVVVKSGQAVKKSRVDKHGLGVLEEENPKKLKDFRNIVQSKMVRFWEDPRDIKLAIHETMSEFERRENLVGWVRGSESISSTVTEELARLIKENDELKKRGGESTYAGVSFSQMVLLLEKKGLTEIFLGIRDKLFFKTFDEHKAFVRMGLIKAAGLAGHYVLTQDGQRFSNRHTLEYPGVNTSED